MERENVGAYIKRLYKQSGIAGKLIAASTVVFLFFLILGLVQILFFPPNELIPGSGIYEVGFADIVKSYFAAPGTLSELLYKPWSLITYMFTHDGFRHFFFNMLVLYFSARIFVMFFSERRLLSTYFLGGIFAYLIHVGAYAFFPDLAGDAGPSSVVGASASIMAIFIGAAVHQPGFKIHLFGVIRVPLFVIAALYVLSDLAGIGSGDNVAHFAHLGGALFGALSVINANSSKNIMNRIDKLIFKLKLGNISFKRKPKMKVYNTKKEAKNMTDDEYNSNKRARQDRIDAILDKISKKGYEGLTKEEKEILFNESKRK